MAGYAPAVLYILARAYWALDALPSHIAQNSETARAILLQGILDAARSGERDGAALTGAALDKTALFDADDIDVGEIEWRVPVEF